MNNLEGKIESIGKLFSSEFFFKIPYYQRPFGWVEENFQDLIDDLTSVAQGEQYFLGTLVLHKREISKEKFSENSNIEYYYDVVDGQQRLTSLLILFACLRDKIINEKFKGDIHGKIVQEENLVDGIPQLPRLEVKDRSIFSELILTPNGTNANLDLTTSDEKKLRYYEAVKVFNKKLSTFNENELQKLTKFINQKCQIIYLSASTFGDAFRLFSIVNDRGRQLRRIDILKAQNISPETIPLEMTRERVASEWEILEDELGEKSFEAVLHAMRMIIIKEKPQEDLFSEFENRVFNKGIINQGEDFINAVKTYGGLFRQIFIDKDFLKPTHPDYIKFNAMIHIMDTEFEASEWRACLLAYAKKFFEKEILKFTLYIEKIYLSQWTSSVRKDERFGDYSKILKSIDAEAALENITKVISIDDKKIIAAVKGKNFYNSRYAKYMLLRLEVLASEHDVYKEINAKSIEHVFPQKPSTTSTWVNDKDFKEHSNVVNTIGNLVLLSKSKNSSASNHDFTIKKERYLKERVSDYPRSIQITQEDTWSIEKIKSNTDQIALTILRAP